MKVTLGVGVSYSVVGVSYSVVGCKLLCGWV